jgi:hypothetical protein
LDFQFVKVNVWLIESIEQHPSIRASFVEALRHVSHIAEKKLSLIATGM